MRLKVFLPLFLAPAILASCQGPNPMAGVAILGSPPYAQQFTFKGNYVGISFQTEPAAEAIRAQVSKVQFIIGTKMFAATSSTDASRPNTYVWTTTNPCQDLPQGDKVSLKYEMLDASNRVLQTAGATVDIHTCW